MAGNQDWLQDKVREGLDETADQDLQDVAEDDEQENHGDFHYPYKIMISR